MRMYKKITKYTLIIAVTGQIFFGFEVHAAKYNNSIEPVFDLDGHDSSGFDKYINSKSIVPRLEQDFSGSYFEDIKSSTSQNYTFIIDHLKNKQYKEARKKITTSLANTPKAPILYILQAQLEELENNQILAEKNYQKAIQLDPDNLFARQSLAKIAIQKGDLNKAKQLGNKILAINNKSLSAYALLANIAIEQHSFKEAEILLLKAYDITKGNVETEVRLATILGRFYVAQKQKQKNLTLAQDLIERHPRNTLALAVLANAQLINNQNQAAEKSFRKIINKEKQNTQLRIVSRILLANLLSNNPAKESEVLNLLDEAFEIKPDNPQALVLKASYLTKKGRYQQALSVANKVNNLFPALSISYQLKGDTYLAERKFDQALKAYQKVYKITPNIQALLTISDLLVIEKKPEVAITTLQTELKKFDNNRAIYFKLANIYQQQGNVEKTIKYYNTMLTEQADDVLALNNLASIYSQQNKPIALELSAKAYKLAPKSADIADTYGYILVKQGNTTKGLEILQQAAKIAPDSGDIQFHLAKAYHLSGNPHKAVEILEALSKTNKYFLEKEKENAKQLLIKLKN